MPERTSKSSGGGTRASKARAGGTAASRADRAAERRAAIVQAAMDEFIARGFAATRLDDIARRAGVAKGTIYLHFKDKESMFEELIRTAILPFVSRLAAPPPPSGSVRDMVEVLAKMFLQEVAGTRRADLVRLIIAEGPRFPAIADFYYREVVSRGLAAMRGLIQLAIARGEIREPKLVQFPQLMIAPMMVAVIWKSLFEHHAPLDAEAMLHTHLDLIFGARRPT
ncbi:TetR/AcrR family transcriptional regulator; helix-turn-helix transcriptional regulator [Bradyrhizobium ontarionense]|uniref:TetR/AcrR family transcriptional regulator helix-turn-helix transcriptional regulator n=1 Tax=Bradyrhizobium ontarionense TaxID=2898149 RepID=A0ABY3RH55_9BRAD|nr:TetR/AcrR family transcriptional regulator [Bradyrhizobium sp. A19]UFZ06651.1 TetR/AcrR family transcriptional regulator; helix-turn-helix transcriptional regulator [Bradyrhizobium sp. A19]